MYVLLNRCGPKVCPDGTGTIWSFLTYTYPQYCDPADGVCKMCYNDGHCTSSLKPVCSSNNECVACTNDDHCTSSPFCNALACPFPYCKTDVNWCVACTANDHCGTGCTCNTLLGVCNCPDSVDGDGSDSK